MVPSSCDTTTGIASALRNANFRNLLTEASAFDGGDSALVANQGEFVLILAADLKALCYILGSYAHVVAVDRDSRVPRSGRRASWASPIRKPSKRA